MERTIHFVPTREHFDGYEHFNNGFFPIGFAEGRRDLLCHREFFEPVLSKGFGFLGREVSYVYKAKVLPGQEVDIYTKVDEHFRGEKIILSQSMMTGEKVMATAKMICNLNGESYRIGDKFADVMQGKHESRIVLNIKNEHVSDGIVKDGAFPQYLEEGRLQLALQTGLNVRALVEKNIGFLVMGAIYRYTGRIRGDQELRVVSQYAPYRKEVRVEIKQQVTSGEKVVVEAHLYYFFYNFSTSRPIRPPEDIMRKARLID